MNLKVLNTLKMRLVIFCLVLIGVGFFFYQPRSPMHRVAVHPEEFYTKHRIDTEKRVFELLKAKPLSVEVTYVGVPWHRLIELNDWSQDYAKFEADFENIAISNGFTVFQSDEYLESIPFLKKLGIDTVFVVHATKEEVDGVKIVPFPYTEQNGAPPAKVKDIHYSFIGWRSHPCREKLRNIAQAPGSHIILRDDFGLNYRKTSKVTEYKDVLSRSRFSLCPRGNGPNSLRFYESLQAGAIPVLISDELILPRGIDWDAAIVRVPEADIETIPERLAAISPSEEEAMRKKCLQIFAEYVEGDNIIRIIKEYYDKN